jgi:hypothetical protein
LGEAEPLSFHGPYPPERSISHYGIDIGFAAFQGNFFFQEIFRRVYRRLEIFRDHSSTSQKLN